MHETCASCGLKYEREPGFFLGSIYFNYGLTAMVATMVYPIATFGLKYPRTPTIVCIVTFVVLFPICFFRHARSLWIGFDQFVDPRTESEP
jgi:Ca2+/Na+ antiporter